MKTSATSAAGRTSRTITAIRSSGTCFSGGTRATLAGTIKILRNVWTELIERDGVVLNIVSLNCLSGDFARGNGSIKNQVTCNEPIGKVVRRQGSKCQIVSGESATDKLICRYSAIDDIFIGDRVVGNFGAIDGAIRDFGGGDGIVCNFAGGDGKRRNFLGSDGAILNILCIDDTVSAHTESDFNPFRLETVDGKRRNGCNQNVAVAQIDESVPADIDGIPCLFNIKSSAYIEGGVHCGIDCSSAGDDGIASTRVGSNRIIVQNAGRDETEGHAFKNGG